MKQSTKTRYYSILSLITLFFLICINLIINPYENRQYTGDRILIYTFFIFCCIIGATLSISPGWYKTLLSKPVKKKKKKEKNTYVPRKKGHHPDCTRFTHHTIHIFNKSYCAGCIGLFVGSITAITLTIITFFSLSLLTFSRYFFGIGVLFIFIAFFLLTLKKASSSIRVVTNILIVISFCLLIVGMFEYTKNLTLSMFTIMFCILFIQTRMTLSQNHHRTICNHCHQTCKVYNT